MTLDESIQGMRLRVMKRATAVGVSAACREVGISRTLFYRWQQRSSRYGVDGLHPRRLRARPGPAPQLAPDALSRATLWDRESVNTNPSLDTLVQGLLFEV